MGGIGGLRDGLWVGKERGRSDVECDAHVDGEWGLEEEEILLCDHTPDRCLPSSHDILAAEMASACQERIGSSTTSCRSPCFVERVRIL